MSDLFKVRVIILLTLYRVNQKLFLRIIVLIFIRGIKVKLEMGKKNIISTF